MLKVVVFDSGYGGELFADRLEAELPVLEVIRVIDWRNANKFLTSPKAARRLTQNALRPYIGRVDLIILANHLLSLTSLKVFQRKYKSQKFLGFSLPIPSTFLQRDTLILTTRAITHTISYYNYLFHLNRRAKTIALDDWPAKIDDGELTRPEISDTLKKLLFKSNLAPQEVILACSQFSDIKTELKAVFGQNLKIYDSFDDTIRNACKLLNLRGGVGKKSR